MNKPWLKEYPAGMPETIDYNNETLVDMFIQSCQSFKNRRAFCCQGTYLTYQTVFEYAQAFAAYLQHELHLQKGDRIAVMMPNILQYPIAVLGILMAGGVSVNLNPLDRADAIKHELLDSEARAIVVLENFAGELAKVVEETQLEQVIITSVGSMHAWWKGLAINFVVRKILHAVPKVRFKQAIRFKQALKLGQAYSWQRPMLSGDDMAFLQYTGGTTGQAKGVILLHRNMMGDLYQVHAWVKEFFSAQGDIVITALPLYHIFSLLVNCFLFFYEGAENILIPDPRNMKSFLAVLCKVPYTCITGVNTLFNALLHQEKFRTRGHRHMRIAIAGGMAVQKAVADNWQETTGIAICQGYGLSETSPVLTINPIDSTTFTGSVGLPIPSTLISIRNEQNEELGIGEIGEVCVSGPQVMPGYWHNEAETKKAFTPDGWFRTQDAGYLDERGYLFLVDRLKDMVIVSGFNVYPAEVENIIKTMPGVNEVAVIGLPDVKHGEVVKAYIVKEEAVALTEAEVIQFCHDKLAAYKCPRMVEFVATLPKSPVGKILKRVLRDEEMNHAK